MSSSGTPYLNIDGYNPYSSGWYLLPVNAYKVQVDTAIGLSAALVSVLNAHTLQGLIELVYVRVGNDVLFQGLDGLDTALEATTRTLEILTSVQELHNALVTSSLGSFSAWFRFSNTYSSQGRYEENYNSVASAFFGVPIFPDFIFSSEGAVLNQGETDELSYHDYAANMVQVRSNLASQVSVLESLATAEELNDPNSLYSTTKKVLDDFPPVYDDLDDKIAWSDAKLWAMDFYGAYEGQDLAQAEAKDVVVEYFGSQVPTVWRQTSISPGRQIGMGTGYRGTGANKIALNGFASIRIVASDQYMLAQDDTGQKGTIKITFSGRMAIAFDGWDTGDAASGSPPTIIMINPIDSEGNVANPIVGDNAGATASEVPVAAGDHYIGTFGGVTRGQAQNAGSFQQNITLAMTAAQGLNNSQTEQVRGYLFTFEEYYKSASSVLSSLTQLIQKYAQGIRPA